MRECTKCFYSVIVKIAANFRNAITRFNSQSSLENNQSRYSPSHSNFNCVQVVHYHKLSNNWNFCIYIMDPKFFRENWKISNKSYFRVADNTEFRWIFSKLVKCIAKRFFRKSYQRTRIDERKREKYEYSSSLLWNSSHIKLIRKFTLNSPYIYQR